MTQIKSEKAKSYLNEKGYTMYGEPVIYLTSATKAVIFAETEAEERHAKQLQELKDKAVEEFCNNCIFSGSCFDRICPVSQSFTQKLNEK